MIRSRHDVTTLTVLLAAVVVLGAACVKPGAPDVAISKIEAQLVFGVPDDEPTVSPVAPAVRQFAAPPPADDAPVEAEAPPLTFKPFTGQKFEGPPLVATSSCPTAAEGAGAKFPAGNFIQNQADTGIYRWNTVLHAPNALGEMVDRKGRFDRIVRNYRETSPGIFEWETIEPYGENVMINVFEAHAQDFSIDPTPPVQGLVESPIKIGTPERGVILKSYRIENQQGQQQPGGFSPREGLLLLPVPVEPGERYQSVAVDSRGTTIVQEAIVKNVVRIDACGEVVDGWLVEATRSVTDGSEEGSDEYQYHYVIAPQHGGMLLQEKYIFAPRNAPEELKPVVGDVQATDPISFTLTLGQLTPRPLPTETG